MMDLTGVFLFIDNVSMRLILLVQMEFVSAQHPQTLYNQDAAQK